MGAAGSVCSARRAAGGPDVPAVATEMETGHEGPLTSQEFVIFNLYFYPFVTFNAAPASWTTPMRAGTKMSTSVLWPRSVSFLGKKEAGLSSSVAAGGGARGVVVTVENKQTALHF